MLTTSRIVWLATALILAGCANTKTAGGATEATLCRIWGESLSTRSRFDTAETKRDIAESYADFVEACPGWAGIVP
ncbi:hypothetical protein [Ruegeria atlantica]|uniref:hypothetical protein n=1 Tax=Ruegeria atlantica TaxID=81569 RepID=UPI0020C58BB2|nr:hypothetical protein [Ruegeria atlantica]